MQSPKRAWGLLTQHALLLFVHSSIQGNKYFSQCVRKSAALTQLNHIWLKNHLFISGVSKVRSGGLLWPVFKFQPGPSLCVIKSIIHGRPAWDNVQSFTIFLKIYISPVDGSRRGCTLAAWPSRIVRIHGHSGSLLTGLICFIFKGRTLFVKGKVEAWIKIANLISYAEVVPNWKL